MDIAHLIQDQSSPFLEDQTPQESFTPIEQRDEISEDRSTDLTFTVIDETRTPLFTTEDAKVAAQVKAALPDNHFIVNWQKDSEVARELLAQCPSFEPEVENNVEIFWAYIPLWVTETLSSIWSAVPCYRPQGDQDLLAIPCANSPYTAIFSNALSAEGYPFLKNYESEEALNKRALAQEMVFARNFIISTVRDDRPHTVLDTVKDPAVVTAVILAHKYLKNRGCLPDNPNTAGALWALLSNGTIPRINTSSAEAKSVLMVLRYAKRLLFTAPRRPANIKASSSLMSNMIDEIAARLLFAR
jgi:hypothetical protein